MGGSPVMLVVLHFIVSLHGSPLHVRLFSGHHVGIAKNSCPGFYVNCKTTFISLARVEHIAGYLIKNVAEPIIWESVGNGNLMRERKDINYGADLTSGRLWAAYRQETDALVLAVLTPSRIRIPLSPEDDLALDG